MKTLINIYDQNGEGAGCSSYDDIAAPEPEEPEIPNSGTRDIKHEKTSLLQDIKQENSSPAPCLSSFPLQPNMKIKEEVTDPMYHLVNILFYKNYIWNYLFPWSYRFYKSELGLEYRAGYWVTPTSLLIISSYLKFQKGLDFLHTLCSQIIAT